MIFNEHSALEGRHAFLSASKYHWIRYDDDKLKETYANHLAKIRGTELHDFAATCIRLGQRLPRSRQTLNMYVNDAIGYRMTPEQPLYFSQNCFGTADAISFRKGLLRVHDLKTGVVPAHMEQLEVYAALFCLEYDMDPESIKMELRIYQNCDILMHEPEPEAIAEIMHTIERFDKEIEEIRNEFVE